MLHPGIIAPRPQDEGRLTSPLVYGLDYRPDSADLFEALLTSNWPVFLDSGQAGGDRGRYDILSAEPAMRLVTRGAKTWIRSARGTQTSLADPLELLGEWLGPGRAGVPGLPFAGGAIGYLAYDLARRLDGLPSRAADAEGLPEMAIGIYDWAIIVDHLLAQTCLVSWRPGGPPRHLGSLMELGSVHRRRRPGQGFRVLGPLRSNMEPARYRTKLLRIKHYLHEGDCYQVNLAQRFAAAAAGDAWPAYRALRRHAPAPFSAYLRTADWQILCVSPERFLRLQDGVVETRPIKGTRPRGKDLLEDARLARALRESDKDRAENLMIVDLLRNDLGKVAVTGSVQVPELFAVEHFAQVHHLVSTIRARLAQGRTALDLLRACFPGGSITGAPKRRAMEIIEELEPNRRGVYTGTIGYIGFDGAMDTNIAIRTLVYSGGTARFSAGGGIVADSDPDREYRETYDKAAGLLQVLAAFQGKPSRLPA